MGINKKITLRLIPLSWNFLKKVELIYFRIEGPGIMKSILLEYINLLNENLIYMRI